MSVCHRPSYLIAAAFVVAASAPSNAVELRQTIVRKGTQGLVATPLSVSNSGPDALECMAELAHWYSLPVASVAPDDSTVIALWFDPATGTFTLLNDKDENMPVESLWCGVAGRAYESRARIGLERRAGETSAAWALTCATASGKATCE